jgi:hypothetical protein
MAGKMMVAMAMVALLGASAYAAQDEFVKVDMRGKLHTNVKEGRTTLEVGGKIYDLDLGNSGGLLRFAERHDRDAVRIVGSLDNNTAEDARPLVFVDKMEAGNEMVSYEKPVERRVIEERPVRERVIVRERGSDDFIKVGPLRIGN